MSNLTREAIALMKQRGLEHREEPFKLASGELSHEYIDGKYAVDSGARLSLVARAIIQVAADHQVIFNTVGGLTMGADAIAHGVAIHAGADWFSVRKEAKPRGHEAWIEGSRLSAESRVLLVDDVVSMGGSIMKAYERVLSVGASVVGVIPMVDRGEHGRQGFEKVGVPYFPLMTYRDLGIEPVGGSLVSSASS